MICEKEDSFLEDKTIWIAVLNNGQTVYQDDDRENLEERSAWIRLKSYLNKNNLKINSLYLKFRSNILTILPVNSSGYFFSKGIMASTSYEKNVFYYSIGYIDDQKVFIKKIKIPELLLFEQEVREVYNCKEDQLIFN